MLTLQSRRYHKIGVMPRACRNSSQIRRTAGASAKIEVWDILQGEYVNIGLGFLRHKQPGGVTHMRYHATKFNSGSQW